VLAFVDVARGIGHGARGSEVRRGGDELLLGAEQIEMGVPTGGRAVVEQKQAAFSGFEAHLGAGERAFDDNAFAFQRRHARLGRFGCGGRGAARLAQGREPAGVGALGGEPLADVAKRGVFVGEPDVELLLERSGVARDERGAGLLGAPNVGELGLGGGEITEGAFQRGTIGARVGDLGEASLRTDDVGGPKRGTVEITADGSGGDIDPGGDGGIAHDDRVKIRPADPNPEQDEHAKADPGCAAPGAVGDGGAFQDGTSGWKAMKGGEDDRIRAGNPADKLIGQWLESRQRNRPACAT